MTDLWSAPREPEIELEPEADDEIEIEIEIESAADQAPADPVDAAPAVSLMQVLPADFPLPTLIRFVPDLRLRAAADEAARYALAIEVAGPEGLQKADLALTAVRTSLKAIEESFKEPTEIANDLHKSLTSTRADWLKPGKQAIEQVGRKVYAEQRRLDAIATEERRKAQAEADRQAREAAAKQAREAERAKAPAPVVEELKRQAETAKAAPVQTAATVVPAMAHTTVTKKWTCTIAGTPRDAGDQQPSVEALTDAQRGQFLILLKAVLDGRAPIAAVTPNWSYLSKRAKSDESTLAIPGIEAYDAGGVRAKATRARRGE